MDSIGLWLASSGRVEAASVLLGNLGANHPPFGRENDLGFRERALNIVAGHAQVEEWMTRGAAMDRHEIVEYTLAALEP